jgi:hypothetical protein
MVFAAIIGIANYSIYMATIDYMICAYGPYSASATGGNGWSRDFLAGVLTIPATPFFESEFPFHLSTPKQQTDETQISAVDTISRTPRRFWLLSPSSSSSLSTSSTGKVPSSASAHPSHNNSPTSAPGTKVVVSLWPNQCAVASALRLRATTALRDHSRI